MAFNVDLGEQFEFVQRLWANNANFPKVPGSRLPPGLDLVIGQGARPDAGDPPIWGANQQTTVTASPQAVTLLLRLRLRNARLRKLALAHRAALRPASGRAGSRIVPEAATTSTRPS